MFKIKPLLMALAMFLPLVMYSSAVAASVNCVGGTNKTSGATAQYCCGSGTNAVATSIDLGCKGEGDALTDMLFAAIRLLSDGVGLVIIASLIVAGIQFTGSRGDPQASAAAMKRVQSNVTALILFFFAYGILNYLLPGQIL